MTSLIDHTPRIRWNASRSPHPARIASWRALDAITHGEKERYISLYAPDGVIHDPVGKTGVDPTGAGHRGHTALAKFWDESIAKVGILSFIVHASLATDDRVANSLTMMLPTRGGGTALMDCIFVYRVNEDGLLICVAGYWEAPPKSG
jgi:steroid Delta-isomerase